MKIIEPKTPEEFKKYFHLRYEILRKPWNQPFESVKDDIEDKCFHALALNDAKEAIGVCRLQFNNLQEGQIRYMAVRNDYQGKGIGSKVLKFMENIAIEKKIEYLILQARENAVPFYKLNGYEMVESSYLLWEKIQHFLMKKKIL